MDRLQVEWMTTVYRWIGLGALTAMWISSETGPSGLLLILAYFLHATLAISG